MCKFRDLNADEIEVRIGQASDKGVQLLLYKDARVDMAVLDETVMPENWQREHYECKGNLFCKVGINTNYNKPDAQPLWVWKSDCGAESNTEAEKGEASDSFKRACVNWGIGRELYTAPFIWCGAADCTLKEHTLKGEKKYKCYDSFKVTSVTVKDKRITGLTIINESLGGRVVFSFPRVQRQNPSPSQNTNVPPQAPPPVAPQTPPVNPDTAQKREWAKLVRIEEGEHRGFTLGHLRKTYPQEYAKLRSAPPSEQIAVAIQILDEWIAESARSAS